ncbi:uncharacterized protein Z519_12210 [Cladophialophora bantiana CBS 173.52]|uniref:Fumarylacetoacetate hydrolase n=1 Tax=Cladophialophora bantiana (strain ATCC 10958 / CBS 173.52 / CDC B-1940 / NIH 8579) TaxID=1442370 RepID=A0A0D2HRU2_CLAB1|nr:uncharacterized protein Z519_12210 [Cladophialophora bantiana CBS 173.52]KIW87099.1 hypothetical protein Z519_12210 [Cladophialophora bantiana CBS 173.52]
MESEIFAQNMLGNKMSSAVQQDTSSGRLVGGIDGIKNSPSSVPEAPRKPWEQVCFDPALKPEDYQIKGTPDDSTFLILDVNIFDSTGSPPYSGNVLIQGNRITHVGTFPKVDELIADPKVKVVRGRGRTLMSGLGDAHTHLSWNSGDIPALAGLGVEEHTLLTARSAQTYIDSGYTMCLGAASAQERLDVVIRDAINAGKLPGPRYLANCKEITHPQQAVGQNGLSVIANGPEEMRAVVNRHIDLGADSVKLTMSGEEICEPLSSEKCYYDDEETAACVEAAHGRGKRLCAHARARDSVKMCVKHGVDIIFHASWTDEDGMDMLEKNKHKHMVVPAINWLYATLYESESYGYKMSKEERDGYEREFENAKKVLSEMHQRGITVLPGGDYGFAWTPHGTYARDLEHFVNWLGFTPMESLLAATAGVASIFMRGDELGQIKPGYFADCILVDGDPLENIAILQDHSKLDLIMINGRVHKASQKDFMTSAERKARVTTSLNGHITPSEKPTNFVAYTDSTGRSRIGHLDLEGHSITPLSMPSGAPLRTLYEVIELAEGPVADEALIPLESTTLLPPLSGRDILAVGKNYVEHAKEFHKSGYDSSDKNAQPSHPVIFTKRSTSIVSTGADIVLDPHFTSTLDYEGEIGVIVGKPGRHINEKDAMNYVWGYTIINDVTAREVQRDHKQFYLGKSGDTYCPMGPIAVPAASLPDKLRVETFVNGEKRQDATTDELIFSVARLISTISLGETIQAGDVIATGTPAGVGFGQTSPTFLQPGDVIEVKVTGLGTLRNQVVLQKPEHSLSARPRVPSVLQTYNTSRTPGASGLTRIDSKLVNVEISGEGVARLIFVHGLGGSTEFYAPLRKTAHLDQTHKCICYDIEGHGLSPTESSSTISIQSYAADLAALFKHFKNQPSVLVAHSMGSLIALSFAAQHPELVQKLILLGPARYPVSAAAAGGQSKRAAAVRAGGMRACAETVAMNGTSEKTKTTNVSAYSAVKAILMSQDPEGYAKACTALGRASNLDIDLSKLTMPVLIVTGDEDKVSPIAACQILSEKLPNARLEVIKGIGHWSVIEDPVAVGDAVKQFLNK